MKKINLLNKTISHLSSGYGFSPFHGKGVRLNSRGVWELPRRTPCATPSWKEGERSVSGRCGLWFAALVALFIATPSFATPTELDKKTVASKAYVDTKQDIIETGLVNYYSMADDETKQVPSLVSYDSTNGLKGNQIGILDFENTDNDGFLDLTGSAMDNFVPTVRAVAGVIQRLNWYNYNTTYTSAINAYSTGFGNGTNRWAGDGGHLIDGYFLANSLALKQNRITTGLVEFNDNPEFMLPAITTYDSTSGLVANKIGILDQETIGNDGDYLDAYSSHNGYGAEMDNYVPTVRAVAEILAEKQNKLPAAWTGTTNPGAVASTGGQTIDLRAYDGAVGRRYITAGGSQPLTQKTGADNVILYINGTKTLAQYQTSNFGGTGDIATANQNYIKGALVSLELLKDVYSALHTEIQNATPTGTPGNVAMYDATTGELGDGVATYDGSTTYNASTDADKIAVMSGVQRKKECGGYEPGHENDPDYCWLWIFPD